MSFPDDSTDAALDPASMLAIVADQQRTIDRKMLAPLPWMYGSWGVAWLVGYLVLWSARGGSPGIIVPGPTAGVVFGVLVLAAIITSAVLGSRINRGVRGASDFQGMVYGISWSVCGFATFGLGAGLAYNDAGSDLISVYFPSGFGLMVGTLYLTGAALWSSRSQLVLGVALLVVSVAAPFAGQPGNNLVMAAAGGGTFIIAAAVTAARLRSRS